MDDIYLNVSRAVDPSWVMRDLSFEPDDWQTRLLRSRSTRVLLLASRQIGKSTCVACMALHTACFVDGSLSLLLAPTERQSSELMAKVLEFHRRLSSTPSVKQTMTALELANASRVVCLPGSEPDNVRGFSAPDLVVIDEASRCDDRLFGAVLPMVSANAGRLVLLSTPHGRRGRFWEWWEESDGSWEKINARAADCVRISPASLQEQRATLGERVYMQEFENVFLDSDDSVFSHDSIQRLFVDDVADGGRDVWSDYLVGLDLGSHVDFTAMCVMRRWRLVGADGEPEADSRGEPIYRYDIMQIRRWPLRTSYTEVVSDLVAMIVSRELPSWPRVCIDGSGVGTAVVDLVREALANHPASECWACTITAGSSSRLASWRWLNISKSELVGVLRAALETGRLKVDLNEDGEPIQHSDILRRELADFSSKLSSSGVETTSGRSEHDDVVIACALPLVIGALRPTRLIEYALSGQEPVSVLQPRRSFQVRSAFQPASRPPAATKLDDAEVDLDSVEWTKVTG
jgi:hypothetical protein